MSEILKKSERDSKLLCSVLLHEDYLLIRAILSLLKKNENGVTMSHITEFIHFHEILRPMTEKFVKLRYKKENEGRKTQNFSITQI